MDRRTDERTDRQKIFPFYRTSSPIGAAALPSPMKTKEKVKQGKGTADHLMPLGCLFFFISSLLPYPNIFSLFPDDRFWAAAPIGDEVL